uniref:hypothetical protein n=1 Tax=Sandarakinorhabdus rubra TaxID=2672568 RepID=UPI00196A0891
MNRPTATPREWAIALAGGLALAAGLVTLLRRETSPPNVPPVPPVVASAPAPSVPAPSPVPGPAPGDL